MIPYKRRDGVSMNAQLGMTISTRTIAEPSAVVTFNYSVPPLLGSITVTDITLPLWII